VKHATDGVKKISEKIQNSPLAPKLFTMLMHEQNSLADEAIKQRKMSVERPRDHLSVADLGFERDRLANPLWRGEWFAGYAAVAA